jgi:large subunit ribosomal protein L10
MELANLESREVLLAKLAGAMKGSFAKAARIIDALRIKMEAVSEPTAKNAEAEVPAPATTTEDVVVAAVTETAPEAVTEEVTTPEATSETEEKE